MKRDLVELTNGACWALFGLCLLLALWQFGEIGQFGTNDFIEYWTAFRAFANGQSGYDPTALQALQLSLGRVADSPLMMWNPPWLLTLLYPILKFDYLSAASAWYMTSLILAVVSAVLIWRSFPGTKLGIFLFLTFTFFPLWVNFELGQVGVLLLLGTALLLYGLERNRSAVAACGLVLLSIKIHVVYLLVIALLQRSIRLGEYRLWFHALVIGAALFIGTELLIPGAFGAWLNTMAANSGGTGFIQIQSWRVASLVSVVRDLFATDAGAPVWPMIVVPGVTACVTLFVLSQRKTAFRPRETLPMLLVASCFTSAFCWIFDQSVLLVSVLAIVATVMGEKRRVSLLLTIIALVGISLTAFALRGTVITEHQQYFWFPVPIGVLLWACRGTGGARSG